jgi:GNAT superfamily N-acetyltransferase
VEPGELSFEELNIGSWPSFEILFGKNGACGGCWCMTHRLPPKEYSKNKGEGNKRSMKNLVRTKEPLGIIAFHGNLPIGWCSISPKVSLLKMRSSRMMQHTTSENTWSIVCLYIKKDFRKQGLSTLLIRKAAETAFRRHAEIVEAYPIVNTGKMPDAFAWNGIASAYKKAGFNEVVQLSRTRVVMRLIKP